jgi:hypothetical protein
MRGRYRSPCMSCLAWQWAAAAAMPQATAATVASLKRVSAPYLHAIVNLRCPSAFSRTHRISHIARTLGGKQALQAGRAAAAAAAAAHVSRVTDRIEGGRPKLWRPGSSRSTASRGSDAW